MLRRLFAPSVIRMTPNVASQYAAVQELVRPWEVARLVPRNESPVLELQDPFANRVARWLRENFASGTFAYQSDPGGFLDYWRSPAATLRVGRGDCEDFALLALSMLVARGIYAQLALGTLRSLWGEGEHAWVEGVDAQGFFLIEATNGEIHRGSRPLSYGWRWGIEPKRA